MIFLKIVFKRIIEKIQNLFEKNPIYKKIKLEKRLKMASKVISVSFFIIR
jgi:hypothetical protein